MTTAFTHDPALTVPSSNTTAGAAVKWVAASNIGESLIILDSGGNGRIGLAGDLDLITLTANTVTVAGAVTASGTVTANLIAGAAVKDEDNMASNSATHLASQQSIKAYVDASGGGGAVSRVGGNTTEATTTGTNTTGLAASSLSIVAADPFQLIVSGRRSSGSAGWAGHGLKLNSTVVTTPAVNTASIWFTNQDYNRACSGTGFMISSGRSSTYDRGGCGVMGAWYANGSETHAVAGTALTAAWGTSTITALALTLYSASSSNTCGADELHIYELSTS